MPLLQPTVDEVTTTNTLEVWRDKLHREQRCARAAARDLPSHRAAPATTTTESRATTLWPCFTTCMCTCTCAQVKSRVAPSVGLHVWRRLPPSQHGAPVAPDPHPAAPATAWACAAARRAHCECTALGSSRGQGLPAVARREREQQQDWQRRAEHPLDANRLHLQLG